MRPHVPILLLVWQLLRPLRTFSCNAAKGNIAGSLVGGKLQVTQAELFFKTQPAAIDAGHLQLTKEICHYRDDVIVRVVGLLCGKCSFQFTLRNNVKCYTVVIMQLWKNWCSKDFANVLFLLRKQSRVIIFMGSLPWRRILEYNCFCHTRILWNLIYAVLP